MSKKEIDEIASQCEALGWGVEKTSRNLYRITPPSGDIIIGPSTANGRSLGNFKAELRAAGFNPEAAQAARTERAATALAVDRKKNDVALARATRRAAEAATTPAPVAVPKGALVNPFTAPAQATPASVNDGMSDVQKFKLLSGYPREAVFVSQPHATMILAHAKEAQENGGCRQRNLYRTNAAKLQQGMELGEFELNPADSLVFCKEHNSIVNGQHRMKGLEDADPEFIKEFYPDGVPFYVTTGFPCAMSHIFDTGRARSAADALTVEGLEGWGPLAASALRLALNYDQSFEPGGVPLWGQWRNVQYTNTELVAAAAGKYRPLLTHNMVTSRAYTRSRVTRSAAMVAAYLIDRDNPGGDGKDKPNSLFWKGVCGDDTMQAGDPRMALVRFCMRTGSKYRSDNGPHTLSHILRRYADYMIGKKKVEISQANRELPMPPVWRPGMRWFGQELRYSKYPSQE